LANARRTGYLLRCSKTIRGDHHDKDTAMTNPAMPNLPGFGAITDTMEFMRTMWGGMNAPGVGIPGMVMPSLSVEEINKQIADLKAVESWLTLNMNMLRGTIQALEVQSATIATLRSMGETLSASVKAPAATAAGTPSAFSFPFGAAAAAATPSPAPAPAPVAPSWPDLAAARAERAPSAPPAPAEPAVPSEWATAPPQAPAMASPAATAPGNTGAAGMAAPLANPAAWWSLLQDQFKQAVSTAIAPDSSATASAGASSKAPRAGAPVAGASPKTTAAAKKTSAARTRKSAPKPAAKVVRKKPA
jgi:hypothetical protein